MKIQTKITKVFAAASAALIMTTTAFNLTASAAQISTDGVGGVYCTASNSDIDLYDGYSIIDGSFENDRNFKIDFKYSDSLFSTDPFVFDPHMATLSVAMAEASTTYKDENDVTMVPDYTTIGGGIILNRGDNPYFHSAKRIASVLKQCKFQNIEVSESYTVKPTADSIACAFGTREIQTENGPRTVVSITVRSASYDAEWASNVTLGTEGEAKGFADSANQVIAYLNDYMNAHPEIREAADEGECYFWVQGFSRGGAVANLTAKRLIDGYQAIGDRVYAYTFEAPRGGVRSEMHSDRDYSCINNIIETNDFVTYVAPEDMGFMRYGTNLCIYLNNTLADEVTKELKKMLGEENYKEYVPFALDGNKTADCIKSVMKSVCGEVSRTDYVNKGIQSACRRLMNFIFTYGIDTDELMKTVDLANLLNEASPAIEGILEDPEKKLMNKFVSWILGPEYGKCIDPLYAAKESLLSSVKNALINDKGLDELFKEYEGGKKAMIDDVYLVLDKVLDAGIGNISDTVTLAKNFKNIYRNHSMMQTLAYMRLNDTWYNE